MRAGKGMHSRLYKRVLNKYDWVSNCTAFNSLYNDSGLVGIFVSGASHHAGDLVNLLTKELQARAQSKSIPSSLFDPPFAPLS
jgi:processing peptidase subunit alpha